MIKSTFELEKKLIDKGYQYIIGIDEVGRGPLAGPVVACAALYKNFPHPQTPSPLGRGWLEEPGEGQFDLIRDSKLLSHKQRESVFDFISENFYVGIGMCDHETIDRMNILEASFLAMKKALNELSHSLEREMHMRTIVLIDGNKKIPNLSIEQMPIIEGDKAVKSISAASIIAKVTRDRIMEDMHKLYPEYGFDKHKGYGTKLHFQMLQMHGPCKIHRKSFEPVSTLVKGKK